MALHSATLKLRKKKRFLFTNKIKIQSYCDADFTEQKNVNVAILSRPGIGLLFFK